MQHKILEKRWKFAPDLPLPTFGPMNSDGETCCKNTSSNSNNYLTLRSCPNCALQYFITLDTEGPSGMVHPCREYTLPRNDLRSRARGWIRKNTKIGPVLNVHVCHHEDRYIIEIHVRSLFQDRTASLGSNCEWN